MTPSLLYSFRTNTLPSPPATLPPDSGLSSWDALIDGLLAIPANANSLQQHSKQLSLSCAAAAATPALDHPYHATAAARAAEIVSERDAARRAAQAPAAAVAAAPAAAATATAAATSTAAPAYSDPPFLYSAVPVVASEIWFPKSEEEVEVWSAVMGLCSELACKRAVEVTKERQEKAERKAAAFAEGRTPTHFPHPQLFAGANIALEHLEVVVLLGLLKRSKEFCSASIKNAARMREVRGGDGVILIGICGSVVSENRMQVP